MKPSLRNLPVMLTTGLLIAGTSFCLALDSAPEKKLSFTILHTNDLHSHDDSFIEGGRLVGGMPRIAHLIKTLKLNSKNKVIAVDAGDIFQGTPYFEQYRGRAEIECLNKSGYDLYTIGNHEFDEGAANLAKQLELAKFEVLNCNLDLTAVPKLSSIVKPSSVRLIDGEKVAFIGVITPELNALTTKLEGVKLKAAGSRWTEPVSQEARRLRELGINKIIVISHCGLEYEKVLAEAVPEIDVIIGGHSHTRLERPVVVRRPDGSACYIVQTGSYGRALGRLDLVFDAYGKLVDDRTKYRLINVTSRIFEDSQVREYVTEMGKPFASLRTTVAGTAETNFDNRFKNYPWDSPMGNLITDALADEGSLHGATIAFQNRGGIRGKLEQGPITLEKLREILPFENHLIVATIDGATLRKALENSVSGMSGGRFFDVKGLKFAYDPGKPAGQRVVFSMARHPQGKWEPVAPSRFYRIAVNSYSFGGGEGYDFSTATDVVDTGKRLSEVLQSYLQKKKTVRPEAPSRFLPVTGDIAQVRLKGEVVELLLDVKTAPLAEVALVEGSGPGVEFVPSVGVVPLRNPRLIGSGKTDSTGGMIKVLPNSDKQAKARKAAPDRWVAAIIRTYGGSPGGRVRIATVPLRLSGATSDAAFDREANAELSSRTSEQALRRLSGRSAR